MLPLHRSKKLTNPITPTVYSLVTTSTKYLFNVDQITTSGGNFNFFFGRRLGQKYRS